MLKLNKKKDYCSLHVAQPTLSNTEEERQIRRETRGLLSCSARTLYPAHITNLLHSQSKHLHSVCVWGFHVHADFALDFKTRPPPHQKKTEFKRIGYR